MKGIVNQPLNNRLSPSVNAKILGFFNIDQQISVRNAVLGDSYEGEDKWYRIADGSYVWSGAVDLITECDELSDEDRIQWLISYRRLRGNKPDLGADKPDTRLYFSRITLPVEEASISFDTRINTDRFIDDFVQHLASKNGRHGNVLIYVHGYELKSRASLKMDLFCHMAQNYFSHPDNRFDKIIFLMWPGEGKGNRREVDDKSLIAGEDFSKNGLFETFSKLSSGLNQINVSLNLMVHSFGHQFLNGMLNPPDANHKPAENNIFKNVFLMAPDITHLSAAEGGVVLKNNFESDSGRKEFRYDLSLLKKLASDVYVFYDSDDYLLYVSTKKFVGPAKLDFGDRKSRFELSKDYRNLGNYGITQLSERVPLAFNYENVAGLLNRIRPLESLMYPFDLQRRLVRKAMRQVEADADYTDINIGKILFNINQFPDYHRYAFTCEPVVERVMKIMAQADDNPPALAHQ
jgi:hypothetical protein